MKKLQWISAADYHNRLSSALWRKTLAAYTLTLLPLLFFLPLPFTVLLSIAVIIKWIAIWQEKPNLAIIGVLIIFPIGVFLLFTQYRQLGITFSFVALLTVMATCKLLESRNVRDTRVLFLLAMSLMLAFLMYTQSFAIFLYLIFIIAINLYALSQVTARGSRLPVLARWKDIAKLLGFALPFAIIVFFAFPRMNPLWGLPRPSGQGITGLPEEMSMGDLAGLAQSNEISFRVRFKDGKIPRGDQLYWRGPVLWTFDGKNWRQRAQDFSQPLEPLNINKQSAINYEFIPVKPSINWLTALDITTNIPHNASIGSAYQIKMPIRQKGEQRYNLTSMLDYQLDPQALSKRDRTDATQLPKHIDLTQTRNLAQQLYQAGGQTTEGFANNFLKHIANEEYYYSLEPMPGAGDVEKFLFEQKIGFCEHYANAMTLAARSINIPARVVIGYQGGSPNPFTKDFIIREENAHAWVELWIEKKGWTRFDPTAAVAPYRIQNARLDSQSLSGADERAWGSRMAEKFDAVAWMRNAMEASQAFWQNWVINLNRDRQDSLLGGIGLSKMGISIVLIVLSIVLMGFMWLLYQWWQRRPRTDDDALAKAARQLLKQLSKRSMHKFTNESFAQFLRRVGEQHLLTNQPKAWQTAAEQYENIRYREQKEATEQLIKQLDRLEKTLI